MTRRGRGRPSGRPGRNTPARPAYFSNVPRSDRSARPLLLRPSTLRSRARALGAVWGRDGTSVSAPTCGVDHPLELGARNGQGESAGLSSFWSYSRSQPSGPPRVSTPRPRSSDMRGLNSGERQAGHQGCPQASTAAPPCPPLWERRLGPTELHWAKSGHPGGLALSDRRAQVPFRQDSSRFLPARLRRARNSPG